MPKAKEASRGRGQKKNGSGYSSYRFETDKHFKEYVRGRKERKESFLDSVKKDVESRLQEEE